MSNDENPYIVGYKMPPKDSRFAPGKSGNPTGRPKGKKHQTHVLLDCDDPFIREGNRLVEVTENGKRALMTVSEINNRALHNAAMKGSVRAQIYVASRRQEWFKNLNVQRLELFEMACEYKKVWKPEFLRCEASGLAPPAILPHPDDVLIDYATGDVRFVGPNNEADRARWERNEEERRFWLDQISEAEQIASRSQRDARTQARRITLLKFSYKLCCAACPDEATRRGPLYDGGEWYFTEMTRREKAMLKEQRCLNRSKRA